MPEGIPLCSGCVQPICERERWGLCAVVKFLHCRKGTGFALGRQPVCVHTNFGLQMLNRQLLSGILLLERQPFPPLVCTAYVHFSVHLVLGTTERVSPLP